MRPRRVTSPQPVARSPAFVLFPATPSGRNSSHQVSYPQPRVVRSNTSPALLPSPSRATFEVPLQPQPKNDSTAHHHVGRMAIPTAPKVTSVPQATPVHGFDFGPGKSSHVLESPSDMDYPTMSTEIITSTTVTHRIAEPDWQIIEPKTYTTPTSTSSSVASSRKRSPSSASSAQTHITKPSFDMSFEMDEPDYISTGRDPVEISIARQISISRQQRKMLQPLQTSFASARPRMGAAKGSPPVPRIAIGKNERLAETKTSTPTLVTRNETFETQLLQHRKSERIVFEDYD